MTRGTPGLRQVHADRQDCGPVCLCGRCAGEMYDGECGYLWEGRQVCVDCFKAVVTAWLEEAVQEVACALGVESRTL